MWFQGAQRMVTLCSVMFMVDSCTPSRSQPTYFEAESWGLRLPRLPGWQQLPLSDALSSSEPSNSLNQTVLRLSKTPEVAGGPRIEVVVEDLSQLPGAGNLNLAGYAAASRNSMQRLVKNGHIRILNVQQNPLWLGALPVYRIHYHFALAHRPAVRIEQVSLLMVWHKHGISITAVAREELFLPVAAEIDTMLAGLQMPQGATHGPAQLTRPIQPVELGTLGDKTPPTNP